MEKLKVGVLGATGAAGLEFVRGFNGHPWFEVTYLFASEKNAGKTLKEACSLDVSDLPQSICLKTVSNIKEVGPGLDLICSALPSDVAKDIEAQCAQHTPVFSTTSAFRYENDVPILMVEINADHHQILPLQKKRGWKGFVAPGPNCTTVGLAMSLAPLYNALGIERVLMTSYQSVSGGGYKLIQEWKQERKDNPLFNLPDPTEPIENPAIMIENNVIGYIPNEEQKVRAETLKILGKYYNKTQAIEPAKFSIDCQCVRVPTMAGHFIPVFVETRKSATEGDVREIYASFNDRCRKEFGALPSSPKDTIIVLERSPQPYYDANLGSGMSTVVGRIEKSPAFDKGIRYQVLSNNTARGAAKGVIQVAEYLFSIDMSFRQLSLF